MSNVPTQYPFDPRSTVPPLVAVTTLVDMRSLTAMQAAGVLLAGSATVADGGGGLFVWDATSTLPDDGHNTIAPNTTPLVGRWRRTGSWSYQGAWNNGTQYSAGDVVTYLGSAYYAKVPSLGVVPVDGATWGLVASTAVTAATASTIGGIQLAGDIGGTATNPLVVGIRSIGSPAAPPVAGNLMVAGTASNLTYANLSGDVSGGYNATAVIGIGTGISLVPVHANGVKWDSSLTPTISQADLTTASGVGAALTIQAQNETGTTSTGGAVNITSGTGTTAAGAVNVQCGGVTQVSVSPTGAALKVTSPAATAKGFVLQRASAQSVSLLDILDSDGATHLFTLSSAATILQWGSAVINPSLTQTTLGGTGATAGQSLSLTAQAGQAQTGGAANNNGGQLILGSGAAGTGGGGAAGTAGTIAFKDGATALGTFSAASYWQIIADSSSSGLYFQVNQNSQHILLSARGASADVQFYTSSIVFNDSSTNAAVTWSLNGTGATAATLSSGTTFSLTQATVAGTGAIAGTTMTIQAQAGQAQTGGSSNNPGGELLLSGGARGTGGAGAAANHGGVQLQAGGVTGLRVGWDAGTNAPKLAFFTASLIKIPTVSGTLSGATLAQLTTVVTNLLAAINDKGAGLGLVHDTTT